MTKLAETTYEIHELLRNRWSPRAFANQAVEQEKLLSLLEAARWSASGGNAQPWHFIVVTKDDTVAQEKLLAALSGRNPAWAKNAPVLLIGIAKLNLENPRWTAYGYYDLGQALANLTIQAGALDLYVHQMAGFDPAKVKENFNLPEGYEAVTVSAIGYLGSPEDLPDGLREAETAPRTRKPLAEFAFKGNWGNSLQ